MKLSALLAICAASAIFNINCRNVSMKEFQDKKITVASNETVNIKELDLKITNEGCGRYWKTENDPPSEIPYCGLVIMHKDSIIRAGTSFHPFYIGNIEITIDRMNPWGTMEDSVPPGGCRLWVKKLTH